ncbi:6091_t:CDS:2, partial [Dentiscutata heterogama]
ELHRVPILFAIHNQYTWDLCLWNPSDARQPPPIPILNMNRQNIICLNLDNTIIGYLQERRHIIVHIDGTRKFISFPKTQYLRTIVYLKLRTKKVYDDISNNVIDETIDEAIKNYNAKPKGSKLSYKSKKDLKHTIIIQKKSYNIEENARDLRPCHFEKTTFGQQKRSITIVSSHILEKPTSGSFPGFMNDKKRRRKHMKCSTPFTTYSPSEGTCEIGKTNSQRLIRLLIMPTN